MKRKTVTLPAHVLCHWEADVPLTNLRETDVHVCNRYCALLCFSQQFVITIQII